MTTNEHGAVHHDSWRKDAYYLLLLFWTRQIKTGRDRERGREGEREGGRERGREGGRERGKEGGRERELKTHMHTHTNNTKFLCYLCVCACVFCYISLINWRELPAPAVISILMLTNKANKCQLRAFSR